MTQRKRSTVVVHGRYALNDRRLHASREGSHGLQVMTFEQAACQLASGFISHIDRESLYEAVRKVLPKTPMGDLESIKNLPGMVSASTNTLHKVWRSGIDISQYADQHAQSPEARSRLESIAALENAVLEELEQGKCRPLDIVAAARKNIAHAKSILGSIEFSGMTELSPCWRPLLLELAAHIPITWNAGPRETPAWLENTEIEIIRCAAEAPETSCVSTATPYHEAIEALRWARSLIATGQAKPSEIAIASASTAQFDEHILALAADANFKIHFVHGINALTTREGQSAAALADIVVRGISQNRLRRLYYTCKNCRLFKSLPDDWMTVLPRNAPLSDIDSWYRLFDNLNFVDWPLGHECSTKLKKIVDLLDKGTESAEVIGKEFLTGRALKFWENARLSGPDQAIDTYVEGIKLGDRLEPSTCLTWMPAYELASSPRPFVRLIGLNSSRWPRGASEDVLIPDHVIPITEFDPIPVNLGDRRDFDTIRNTTTSQLVFSFARRGQDGRQMGQSPLLFNYEIDSYVRRSAVPQHAYSESDRILARPDEFKQKQQAISAIGCWNDWRSSKITKHDGLVEKNHPLMLNILSRNQSASSLRKLLRNPIGYLWQYGFRWKEPESHSEPLQLDAIDFGNLVHDVLDRALYDIESEGGLMKADVSKIEKAVELKVKEVAAEWESGVAIPPKIIWNRKLEEVQEMAVSALNFKENHIPDAICFGEVPFGNDFDEYSPDRILPWDPARQVKIPETDVLISGKIDRLDLSKNRANALVRDYKTGKPPSESFVIRGGKELQRCLYAFAVKSLLGDDVQIKASLFYPRSDDDLLLDDPEEVLNNLKTYITNAKTSMANGNALPGPDAGENYDELEFALPAQAANIYKSQKLEGTISKLSSFSEIWEEG